MPITFTCRCGNILRTADRNAGKPGKCPACSSPFVVPPSDGGALPPPKADESDYPIRRVTRQPVRERGIFDGLTVDDVQLRPRLDEEDDEQKAARRTHRKNQPAVSYDEDDEVPLSAKTRPLGMIAAGVLAMIGAGVWFRWKLEYGVVVIQAPFLFAAGFVLTMVGALGYYRKSKRPLT